MNLTLSDFGPGTVAWVIQRMIEDIAAQPSMKPLGDTHQYGLEAIQRMPFGRKMAASITRQDWIDFAKWRRKTVTAATTYQTISMLVGALKYVSSSWDDCADIANALASHAAAKAFLDKHNLVGKSAARDRRPTEGELATLGAAGAERNKHRQTKINMERLIRWQPTSGRRISETCRIEWRHWNEAQQTMLVTRMKDPRKRNKTKVVALTDDAQAILYEMAWEMNANPATWNDPEPRIFPYNPKSASAAFYEMRKKAGIEGLRLHDNRREAGSRIIDAGGTSDDAILVTGHDTKQVFDQVYNRPKPELFRERMAKRMQVAS
jgi:integrase